MATRYWPAFTAAAPAPAQGCAPAGAVPFGTTDRLYAAGERARALHLQRIRAELAAPTPTRFLEVARHAY